MVQLNFAFSPHTAFPTEMAAAAAQGIVGGYHDSFFFCTSHGASGWRVILHPFLLNSSRLVKWLRGPFV
jgi:hypothetical protein